MCVRVYACACVCVRVRERERDSFFIRSFVDRPEAVSISWLSQMLRRCTWACRKLCELVLLFPEGKCPEVGLVARTAVLVFGF